MTKLNGWKVMCSTFVMCAAMSIAAQGQTSTTLATFDDTNGGGPSFMTLIQGTDDNLYGTTTYGGGYEKGNVFNVTRQGSITSLYSFCMLQGCPDGQSPDYSSYAGGLVLNEDGSFSGSTPSGGENCSPYDGGCGTLFNISPNGRLMTTHEFNGGDGARVQSPLVHGANGNLYGASYAGGSFEAGTIFEIDRKGTLTVIYGFCKQGPSCSDGAGPTGLVQAPDGYFYGTTSVGGEHNEGTIFRISPNGVLKTIYHFCSRDKCADGAQPMAGLVLGSDGALYGTTLSGGSNLQVCFRGRLDYGCGTIFRLSPTDGFETVYPFCSLPDCGDGRWPSSPLAQATDGNFYGTTPYSNDSTCQLTNAYCGTVFSMTPQGTMTVIHNFCLQSGCPDGPSPEGGVVQATDGELYGTTQGTVYSVDMGLAPFVTFVQPFSKVGQTGGVLGQGFTGTTAVSLNGVPANFTVVSDTFIRATVPSGATTGYVTVTTPSGVLTSNVPLQVIP